MICHALETLAACAAIERVFVVIASDDAEFAELPLSALARRRCEALGVGGATRHDSVENGLLALASRVEPLDWILVHDAARPGLSQTLLARLIESVANDAVGGLLAMPLADTLKRERSAGAPRSAETVPRSGLWQAQTPQMFRHQALLRALQQSRLRGEAVTDEASAIEQAGLEPMLVLGSARNFKVTYPDDMALADLLLKAPS